MPIPLQMLLLAVAGWFNEGQRRQPLRKQDGRSRGLARAGGPQALEVFDPDRWAAIRSVADDSAQ